MRFTRPANCPACNGRMTIRKHATVGIKRKFWMAQLVCKNCGSGIEWMLKSRLRNGRIVDYRYWCSCDINDVMHEWNRIICNHQITTMLLYDVRIIGKRLTRHGAWIMPREECE